MSKEDTAKAIGKIIMGEYGRDAIHVAVAPMTAAHQLFPGQHVGVVDEGKAGVSERPVGIVDPFLRGPVERGQRFFLFLYPGTITSLRHEWVHPAFGDAVQELPPAADKAAPDKAASEAWLRKYAERVNSYDSPEEAFRNLLEGLRTRELYFHGTGLHGFEDLPEPDELLQHAEILLGEKIDWGRFTFSCSC